jgi:hypothetical protein
MMRAEIDANNVQAQKLAEENHAKIAQKSPPVPRRVGSHAYWHAACRGTKPNIRVTDHPDA